MIALPVEDLAHRGEGLRQRKDLRAHEQVRILGPDRMPIDAVGRDRDLGDEIGAGEGEAVFGEAPQRDAADDAVPLGDPLGVEEEAELLGLGFVRDGRREPDAKPFGAGDLDPLEGARPGAAAAIAGRAVPASGCRG